ncbi:MAG: GNAT family N-acetyltransferase [Bacteroidota bacterium]
MFTTRRTTSSNPHFVQLVDALNAWLRVKDGDKHSYYNQFNHIEGIPHVVVVYKDDTPVACGAMKQYDDNTVEIKRMFTDPEQRGNGLGNKVLVELEQWAHELGYQFLILETGKSFEAAVHLYQKYGFQKIPNYDQYEHIEDSVCFRKSITP